MPPKYAALILHALERAGCRAVFAGGCVRDLLLSRRPNDWDIATSAEPREVLRLFPKSVPSGAEYGTVSVRAFGGSVECTTFRSDGEYEDGRHPKSVRFTKSLERDLARRDFTVNAMAMDKSGAVTDPFSGRSDLAARLIRCVGDADVRFREDALRMLRAVRLCAQLGFDIEAETLSALRANAALAGAVSGERVLFELMRALSSDDPGRAGLFFSLGLLAAPAVPRLEGLRLLPKGGLYRLCAMCRLAKIEPDPFFRSLRLKRRSAALCSLALSRSPSRDAALTKRLIADIGPEAARLCAASCGAKYLRSYSKVVRSGECCTMGELAVSGAELVSEAGVPPGKAVGETLKYLLAHVIDRPGDNERSTLLALAAEWRHTR